MAQPPESKRAGVVSQRTSELARQPKVTPNSALDVISDIISEVSDCASTDWFALLRQLKYMRPDTPIIGVSAFSSFVQLVAAIELVGYHRYPAFHAALQKYDLSAVHFREHTALLEMRCNHQNAEARRESQRQMAKAAHTSANKRKQADDESAAFTADIALIKTELQTHNHEVALQAARIADKRAAEAFSRRNALHIDITTINPDAFADRQVVKAAACKIRRFKRQNEAKCVLDAQEAVSCTFKPSISSLDKGIFAETAPVAMTRSALLKSAKPERCDAETPKSGYRTPISESAAQRQRQAFERHCSKQKAAQAEAERIRRALDDPNTVLGLANSAKLTERQRQLFLRLSCTGTTSSPQQASVLLDEQHDAQQCNESSLAHELQSSEQTTETSGGEDGLNGSAAREALQEFLQ